MLALVSQDHHRHPERSPTSSIGFSRLSPDPTPSHTQIYDEEGPAQASGLANKVRGSVEVAGRGEEGGRGLTGSKPQAQGTYQKVR